MRFQTAGASSSDEVARFVREARSSNERTDFRLRHLAVQFEAACRRVAGHAASPSNGSEALLEELSVRDEELTAIIEDLKRQNESLTRATALLERERSKYVDLFEHAPDAYIVTNLRGIVQEANVVACTLLGVEPGTLSGRLLIAFVARQDTRAFRAWLGQLADGEPPHALVLRVRPRGQPVLVVALRAAVVHGPTGKPLAVRWVLHRTDAAERDSSQRAADAELVATLAKDLRAPLSSIAGGLRMLREGAPATGENEQALAWIDRAMAAQETMLTELVELSAAYGGDDSAGQTTDLTESVRRAFVELSHTHPGKRLALEGPYASALVVSGPRLRIDRSIELILRRALEGTPAGGAVGARIGTESGEVIIAIAASEGAVTPAGWGVRLALVLRLVRSCGGQLILTDRTPAAQLRFPCSHAGQNGG